MMKKFQFKKKMMEAALTAMDDAQSECFDPDDLNAEIHCFFGVEGFEAGWALDSWLATTSPPFLVAISGVS